MSTRKSSRSSARNSSGAAPSSVLSGSNIELAHFHNQRVVLETVRLHGPLSRAEISTHTTLSAQTISNIVGKLLDHGTLETHGRRAGRRGQPAIELEINPRGGYAAGLHLDRDHLTGILVDLSGNVLQVLHREWNFPTPEEALPRLAGTVRTLTEDQGLPLEDLWGVGVGLPGPLDYRTGSLVNPPNFPRWDGVPLQGLLSKALGLSVFLETDATAAAVGERWFGQGLDLRDYFYVYFGIGVGGGMILDGKPYRGGFDNAAMFGHVPVGPDSDRCACGGAGCLELYASLASLYAAFQAEGRLHHVAELDALLRQDDRVLMTWLEQAAGRMARGLVIIENLLNPKAIIFGGHLPDSLIDRLIAALDQRLSGMQMRGLKHHPPLLRAQIGEDGVALGAATLPLFEMFTPRQASLMDTKSQAASLF